MQIKARTFNIVAVVAGLALTAAVAHDMATNPRWAGDKGPGVGKLPRQIVSGYLSKAYDEGKGAEAVALYMAKNAVDHAKDASDRVDGAPIKHTVKWVIAEGLTVAVWHCIEASRGEPTREVVDIFRTQNGRIVGAIRPSVQPVASGTCPPAPDAKFTGIR